MNKFLVAVSGVAVMGLVASSAQAQCSFNTAGKAKGIKSSFVRAYSGCGNSSTFPTSNTTTMAPALTAACATPAVQSPYWMEELKGKCDFKTKTKVESPCSNGQPGACANLTLSTKCSGILKPDKLSPTDGSEGDWTLSTLSRATLDDQDNGDMTVIDFPLPVVLGPAVGGKLKSKATTNVLLDNLLGAGSGLPACTSIEIIKVAILDPAGGVFMTLGGSTK